MIEPHLHDWVSNSGMGGSPVFTLSSATSDHPTMNVRCSECNARTWLTENQWLEYPADNQQDKPK